MSNRRQGLILLTSRQQRKPKAIATGLTVSRAWCLVVRQQMFWLSLQGHPVTKKTNPESRSLWLTHQLMGYQNVITRQLMVCRLLKLTWTMCQYPQALSWAKLVKVLRFLRWGSTTAFSPLGQKQLVQWKCYTRQRLNTVRPVNSSGSQLESFRCCSTVWWICLWSMSRQNPCSTWRHFV